MKLSDITKGTIGATVATQKVLPATLFSVITKERRGNILFNLTFEVLDIQSLIPSRNLIFVNYTSDQFLAFFEKCNSDCELLGREISSAESMIGMTFLVGSTFDKQKMIKTHELTGALYTMADMKGTHDFITEYLPSPKMVQNMDDNDIVYLVGGVTSKQQLEAYYQSIVDNLGEPTITPFCSLSAQKNYNL
jgi:hypothetical protein